MKRQQQIVNDEGEVETYKTIKNNQDFVMTFRPAYKKLRELIFKDPKARALFDWMLEQMDTENALIVSRQTLAKVFDWSEQTVSRKVKVLKDEKCLDVKKSGTSNVYLINADIAWTTFADKRQYARFRANVFIGSEEQEHQEREDVKYDRNKHVYLNE